MAENSQQWVHRLGIGRKTLTRLYKDGGVRWNDVFAESREVFDFFTARALAEIESGTRNTNDDSFVFANWEKILCKKLGAESGGGTVEGARAFGWLGVDFACWAMHLPDADMSGYGAAMLAECVKTGTTPVVQVPETSDMYSDVELVRNQVVLDNGEYDERFLIAWGEADIRILGFYRVGIVNREFIESCIAGGIDPELARSITV